MANKTFNKDKVVQKQTCDKCNQTIKILRVAGSGKAKIGKMCDCGIYVGNEKID